MPRPGERSPDEMEQHQQIVLRRRTQRVPWATISKITGTSVATCKRDYVEAKKLFREKWEQEDSERRAEIAEHIHAVMDEAWNNYLQLKARVNQGGKKSERFRLDRNLSMVLKATRDMRDLYGLDVPKQVELLPAKEKVRNEYLTMIEEIDASIEKPIELQVIEAKDVPGTKENGKNGKNGDSNGK